MGDSISNKLVDGRSHGMSNGCVSTFLRELCVRASETAANDWERGFAVWLAEHADPRRWSYSATGFDVSEIAWSRAGFDAQRAFVLGVVAGALESWGEDPVASELPSSEPQASIAILGQMVRSFNEGLVPPEATGTWDISPETPFTLCEEHAAQKTSLGCAWCA
jgi:hypothetical protein